MLLVLLVSIVIFCGVRLLLVDESTCFSPKWFTQFFVSVVSCLLLQLVVKLMASLSMLLPMLIVLMVLVRSAFAFAFELRFGCCRCNRGLFATQVL